MNDTRTLFTSLDHQSKPSEQGLSLVPDPVVRQELKTYVAVDGGFKVTTRTRIYRGTTHDESLSEEVLINRK